MKRHPVMLMVMLGFLISMASVFSVVNFVCGEEHLHGKGVQIHNATVEGYGFEYTLYRFPERKTWHLMVTITGPGGAKVEKGKVGFLVVGPDGSKQKAMAMGMTGAYGADMDLGGKGIYTIKAKAVIENRKLIDTFAYEAK